jgi:hypothetical protein
MVPWQVACRGLPPILEIEFVRPTVPLAIKLLQYEAAMITQVVKRIWIIVNPSSIVQITSPSIIVNLMLPIYQLQQWQNEDECKSNISRHCMRAPKCVFVFVCVWERGRWSSAFIFGSEFKMRKWSNMKNI